LDSGYDVIYIWVDGLRFPLGAGALEYVISHLQFRDGNPTVSRCYRVIRGSGEFIAGGDLDSDDLPDILPSTRSTYPAEVPEGLCGCGCGGRTNLSDGSRAIPKGLPNRYISGHNDPHRSR
jgi:hypothetical protein